MPTYKIPSLLPDIKAAKISVPNNAYTNPQPIIDKSFEAFNTGIQKAIQTGLITANNNREYRAKEKASQDLLVKQNSKKAASKYDGIQGLTYTGNTDFDNSVRNFFYEQKDQYAKIKNIMDNDPSRHEEGSRLLAEINNTIYQYQQVKPHMIAAIQHLKSALNINPKLPGAVSSETPTAIQKLMLSILEGGADVSLVKKKDGLFLYMPPQTIDDGTTKEQTNGAMIDLNAFQNLVTSGGEFIQTIPDWLPELKDAADDVLKNPNDTDKTNYYEFTQKEVGDKMASVGQWRAEIYAGDPDDGPLVVQPTISIPGGLELENPFYDPKYDKDGKLIPQLVDGKMLAQMDLIRTGAFDSLLDPEDPNDNDMSIIWTDVMPDELTDQFDGPWDPANKEMLTVALKWLSKEAVDEFGFKEGVVGTKELTVDTGDGDAEVVGNATDTYNNVTEALVDEKSAFDYFKNIRINGKDIVTETVDGGPGIRITGGVDKDGKEDSSVPRILELDVHNGEYVTATNYDMLNEGARVGDRLHIPRKYDLNNPTDLKTLFGDIVSGEKGKYSGQRGEDIRDEISRLIDFSIEQAKENKKRKLEKSYIGNEKSKTNINLSSKTKGKKDSHWRLKQ